MMESTRVKISKIPMTIEWDGAGYYRLDKNFDEILSGKPIYAETIASLKDSLKLVFDIIATDFYRSMDNTVVSRA